MICDFRLLNLTLNPFVNRFKIDHLKFVIHM